MKYIVDINECTLKTEAVKSSAEVMFEVLSFQPEIETINSYEFDSLSEAYLFYYGAQEKMSAEDLGENLYRISFIEFYEEEIDKEDNKIGYTKRIEEYYPEIL